MTEPIDKPADPLEDKKEDNPQKPTAPSDPQDDKAAKLEGEELPEKFKGKTAADIAKSYQALEKKLGTFKDYEDKTKQLDQFYALAEIINKNPEIKKALLKATGGDAGDEPEDKKPDDTREAVKGEIISTFRKDLGINNLEKENREKLLGDVMSELRDLVDGSSKLSDQQVIDKIPLDSLKRYLNKAYRLATLDDEKEQSRAKGMFEAKKQAEAVFGSFSSSGTKQVESLSPEEKEVAKKMGVSEKAYLKNKQELLN